MMRNTKPPHPNPLPRIGGKGTGLEHNTNTDHRIVHRVPPSLLPFPEGEGGRRPDVGVRRAGLNSTMKTLSPLTLTLSPESGERGQDRRGSVTVLALVTLLIVSTLLAQYTRRVLMERRQYRQEILHQQAEKLAEAGLQLAEDSRSNDPAWTGVTWNLQPGEIHQTNSADVAIQVQDDICTVTVRYPTNNNSFLCKVTRTRKLTP